MKFLITGGAGFIGSALVRYIIQQTADCVINVDKLSYAANLQSLTIVHNHPRYCFEQGDITDRQNMDKLFEKHQPDAVIHLAAETHVDRSIKNAELFIRTNIVGTYILLETARNYWESLSGEQKRKFCFLHISTDEVYGELPYPKEGDTRQNPLFTENTAYAPNSPYSASKASADHFVRAWHHTYGLPTIISNCANNYGPCQFPEKLIPLMILNALAGKMLPVYGQGMQIRDWLFVEDHVRALYLLATQGKVGETYNIGAHCEKKNIEVVYAICDLLDQLVPKSHSYKEQVTFVADRLGHDQRYAIDAHKIFAEFSWKATESFENGLYKTIQWYLNHPDWVNKAKSGEYQNWMKIHYGERML